MIIDPNDETADLQREEVQALEAIFPDALELQSGRDEESFDFPIVYRIKLNEMENNDYNDGTGESCCGDGGTTNWPKHPLSIEIRYPVNYPSEDDHDETENEEEIIATTTTVPQFDLLHENTVIDFPSKISEKLLKLLHDTAINERGMPCILSCLYAARDFLDGDREWDDKNSSKEDNDDNGMNASLGVTTDIYGNENRKVNNNVDSLQIMKYVCISTHHLLDHKPDNLLKTGHKFSLSGFYKFGTPGLAIAWGDIDSIDDFIDTLKRAMPQKKFETVFIRTWKEKDEENDEDHQNGTPKGWKNVDPPTLKIELDMIGVPNEDYYSILGIEKRNDQKDNKCTTEEQKGKSNRYVKGKGKGKKR